MTSNHFSTSVNHCEELCDDAHGGNTGFRKCTLNRGHTNSLAVEEFGMEKLPPGFRTENNMNYIENIIERTVKITVFSTSSNRPDTYPDSQMPYPFSDKKGIDTVRCGTGFIDDTLPKCKKGACLCPECKRSGHPKMKYWMFTVATATHVVFDDIEAERVVVDLFYDKEDKRGVKHLYGLYAKGTSHDRVQTDACDVVCITHDAELMNRLKSIDVLFHLWKLGIVVSHPHGAPKRISLGKFYYRRFVVTESNANPMKLEKGIRVYIPAKHDQQKQTPHCDRGCVSDNPAPNDAVTRSQNSVVENQELDNEVDPNGNITSKSECNFYDLLTPTEITNVFELMAEMKVVPPPNPGIVSDLANSKFSQRGCTFPAGTTFESFDGSVIDVPAATEFNVLPSDSCYITYDMPTCPGSSGAAVLLDYPFVGRWRHFGSSDGGENRSGLLHGWLTGRKYYHDYDALELDDGADGDDDDDDDDDNGDDSEDNDDANDT